ncbi:DEAD/DEAH box helicase [Thiocapsa rosea]|uniref:ATP-dependent RNA helicase RhlB n=1 Tax=Thiocapsa rosea TaxID=69360 RepID=A0A495V323_9GAMM|nr:DEAD/DEAH box helicase [Thiocapsa rosea]RKT43724.1 ATP-dependent RNA helicase RhlB [Thiocapsa rosea]
MTDKHLTQTRFDSFALDQRIIDGLEEAGFTRCTPIQEQTLPIALSGRDVAGQAQTGTGKTAAFLIVLMQRLLTNPGPAPVQIARPRALILAPTRELAVQIHRDTELLAKHTGLRIAVVYGGAGYQEQRDQVAGGVDILIGTPGRLIDYFKQKVFDLQAIEAVVLDEADRMFDLGFIKDIRFLLRRMPPPENRQGLLFSATLSYRVTELAYEHMNHPQLVKIETETITADRVRQSCYMTSNEEKIALLLGLVRGWDDARIMVFVNTKREADRVWGFLQGNGINTAVLSGDVPQKKRLKLLKDFTDGTLPVLVGTDVAARGLHIPDVTHVVNYDLPEDPEDYVHRIGRTARAGAAGDAIGFVCETYAFCLPDIEAFIGAKIPVEPVDPALLAEVNPRSRMRPDREDRCEARPARAPRGGGAGAGRGERRPRSGGERRSPSRSPSRSEEAQPRAPSAETPAETPVAAPRRQPEIAALTDPSAAARLAVSDAPVIDSPEAGAPQTETSTGEPKKRRRRRRAKKPSADGTNPPTPAPAPEPVD